MNQFISRSTVLVLAALLLGACNKSDDDTKKELAAVKAQLAAQQQQEAMRDIRERDNQQLSQQAQADAMNADAAVNRINNPNNNNLANPNPSNNNLNNGATNNNNAALDTNALTATTTPNVPKKPAAPKVVEKRVRYPATIITNGGAMMKLRGTPSTTGVEVTKLEDGDEVTVLAETKVCPVINGTQGCWMKVSTEDGIQGYMFGGFLQREILSKHEKERITGNKSHDDDDDDDGE